MGPLSPPWDYVGGALRGPPGLFPGRGLPDVARLVPDDLAAGAPSAYEQEFANHGYASEPMWLTEFGWPGSAQPGGAYFPGEAAQAADLLQAYTTLLALPFVKGALWFNVRDYQPGYQSPDPSFFYHYGLVDYSFVPKPAATEFTALAAANPGR